jgi:hypothetical protein
MPRERLPDRRQPAALAAGLGKLGDGKSPASIIGAVADVLAGKAAGPSSPGGEAP